MSPNSTKAPAVLAALQRQGLPALWSCQDPCCCMLWYASTLCDASTTRYCSAEACIGADTGKCGSILAPRLHASNTLFHNGDRESASGTGEGHPLPTHTMFGRQNERSHYSASLGAVMTRKCSVRGTANIPVPAAGIGTLLSMLDCMQQSYHRKTILAFCVLVLDLDFDHNVAGQ